MGQIGHSLLISNPREQIQDLSPAIPKIITNYVLSTCSLLGGSARFWEIQEKGEAIVGPENKHVSFQQGDGEWAEDEEGVLNEGQFASDGSQVLWGEMERSPR